MCDYNVAACLLTSRQKNLSFAHYLWKNVIYYKDAAQWGWISPVGISSFFLQRLSDISCTLSSDWSDETHPVVSNRFQGFIFLAPDESGGLHEGSQIHSLTVLNEFFVSEEERAHCWILIGGPHQPIQFWWVGSRLFELLCVMSLSVLLRGKIKKIVDRSPASNLIISI